MLRVGSSKKYTQFSTQTPCIFCHKRINIRLEWLLTVWNGFLKLKSWSFTSMLGLANMSGTWDLGLGTPCELALKCLEAPSKPLHAQNVYLSYIFHLAECVKHDPIQIWHILQVHFSNRLKTIILIFNLDANTKSVFWSSISDRSMFLFCPWHKILY